MSTAPIPAALPRRQFASDNYAPICPPAWDALQQANHGHARAYGGDDWTNRATQLLRDLFDTDCDVFFVFNGTASNALSLAAMCRPYHSVICHRLSHVDTDECGAPEFFTGGSKVITVQTGDGKLTVQALRFAATHGREVHYPKAGAVSLTQSTEAGTVYRADEIGAIAEAAHGLGLHVHMDGARFANAVATLGAAPGAVTWQAGVDVLCFGGTKNGLGVGEAIVFFNRDLAREFEYRRKQTGQLCSKMRYLTAPWVGLLGDGAWLDNARQANRCAAMLAAALAELPGMELAFAVQANAVFVRFPRGIAEGLRDRGWHFYDFDVADAARLMCAWDTTEADVQAFIADVKALIA